MSIKRNESSRLLAECAEVYGLSKRFEAKSDKSAHWNVFPDDFARCFEAHDAWPSLLRNGITAGFNDDTLEVEGRWQRRQQHDYSDLVPRYCQDAEFRHNALWMFKLCGSRFGLPFVEKVLNTEVGSPRLAEFPMTIKYARGDVLRTFRASQYDLSLVYFCGRILEAARSNDAVAANFGSRPTFVEIGGGFGELAAKMKIANPATRSVIFDLPEPGAVQQYFLTQRFPDKKIYTIREFQRFGLSVFDHPFDFLLLPPAMMKLLPAEWSSIVVNIRSFQEMTWISVVDYFVEIQRSIPKSGLFCCINRRSKLIGQQEINYDRFPFDGGWRTLSREPVPFQSHIIEGIFERL